MVKDIITGTEKAVDNVPYGLAIMAKLSSQVGHVMGENIEKALHVSDDTQYTKTGHIFGTENLMDVASFRWTDPIVEENMRKFVTNCMVYDMALGFYSMKDVKHNTNLWPFVRDRTAINRGIYWSSDNQEESGKYCSCREAAKRIDAHFKEEVKHKLQSKHFLKYLPAGFKNLTGLAKSSEQLIMQQLMNHSFVEAVESKSVSLGLGHNLATSRAYLQQQATMNIATSLAGKSIVVIRAIFEALILVSFIFIVPLMAFPMGLQYFSRWAEMVIWVNLWPPIYAVINFILKSSIQARSEALLKLPGATETGLTLANAVPLANLYNDMVAYAGWASTFVPVLAYMILKGGMSSFVHIAGNMMNASQASAGAAAQDQVTGNYSYGNVSTGVINSNMSNMNQLRDAPSMQSGFFHESTGTSDVTYGSDGSAVYRQQISSMATNISASQHMSSSLSRQASESMQKAHTDGVSFSDSMDMATRELTSFDAHMGTNSSANIASSYGMDESTQKSMSSMMSQAKSFGERYNMDQSHAMKYLVGVNAGVSTNVLKKFLPTGVDISGSVGGDMSGGASAQKMYDEAKSITSNEDFQQNMASIERYSENKNWSEGQEEGKRLAESLSSSFGRSQSFGKSISENLTKSESLSEQANFVKDNSARIDQNLNQDFFNFMVAKEGGIPNAISVLESPDEKVKDHVNDRMQEYYASVQEKVLQGANSKVITSKGMASGYEKIAGDYDVKSSALPPNIKGQYAEENQALKKSSGLSNASQDIDQLKQTIQSTKPNTKDQLNDREAKLSQEKRAAEEKFSKEDDKSLIRRQLEIM